MTRFTVLILTVIIFISCELSLAQSGLNVKVSASNLLRYGIGKQTSVTGDIQTEYFEELADVRLFVNEFTLGVRYEYDAPIEYGKSIKGISKRYLEFRKEGFNVRAGNYFELFEKGLILNSFENRGLGWNTQLDGVRINYKNSFKDFKVDATIIGGDLDYTDFVDTSITEYYTLRGGNAIFSPFKYLKFGGSYLWASGNIPTGNIRTDFTAELVEAALGINYKSLNFYSSYARKVTLIDANSIYNYSVPKGDGAYGSLSFTTSGLGITLDYKNYRFNVETPDERSSSFPAKPLPFQVPPSCIKEHTSILLSYNPHNVNFGDEVGFQLDIFYSPSDNLTLNFNGSLSSMHYDYKDVDTSASVIKYERIDRSLDFLPSSKDAFSPYWELFLEAEYYYKKNWKFKIAAAKQYAVIYVIENPSLSDISWTYTIPIEIKYDFKKFYSLKLIAEQQWAYNSVRPEDQKNYLGQYFVLAFSKSPHLVLSASLEFTNDKYDPSGKKVWGSGEVTYKLNSSNQISLFYGSERGGLKCSSGICRYVNPFNGFRLTVSNNIN